MFSLEEFVVKRLSRQTGFPVRAASAKGNLFTGRFRVEGVEIRNPAGFPVTDFLSLAAASAHISPSSFLGQKIEVPELSIHLRQLTGVRAESGAINIEQFRRALERRDSPEPASANGTRRRGKSRRIRIGRLTLRVDHVATIDYSSRGGERREYPVLLEREFRDVKDPLSLGPPLLEHFSAAGLSETTDSIFASVLPDLIWAQLSAAGGPGDS